MISVADTGVNEGGVILTGVQIESAAASW
jgi:hypothetical protein